MYKYIIYLSILLVFYSFALASPLINGTSGNFIHDGNVTITGSSFGTKSAILLYDDFESGTPGQNLNSSPKIGAWTPNENALYSNTTSRSGGQSCYAITDAYNGYTDTHIIVEDLPQSLKFYVSFWFWYKTPDDNSGQAKIFQMHGDDNGASLNDFAPSFHTGGTSGDSGSSWMTYYSNDGSTEEWEKWDYPIANGYPAKETWHQFEIIAKQSSSGGVNDGSIKIMINGVTIYDKQNIISRINSTHWWSDACVFYGATNFSSSPESFIDDIYIDNSWARVEIGDSATYANCTHREMQIPSDWAADEITITVNQGSFSNGTGYYLFVVDANGDASSGYPVTIGSDSSLTMSGTSFSGGMYK